MYVGMGQDEIPTFKSEVTDWAVWALILIAVLEFLTNKRGTS
jgi:hypothetical protein